MMKSKWKMAALICLLLGIAFSGCKEVFEKSLDKVTVVLSAPGNNVVSDSTTQAFWWQPVDTSISYELQIVTPRFDSVVSLVMDTTTGTNILSLTLVPAQYQWRVRAFNSESTSPFSAPWTFTIN
jgi:hypothetical protein